jgi:hypothetical protein
MKGFIYVLSNPSMGGLLKIGFTTKVLEDRVAELNNVTGIPTNFAVEAFFEVDEPNQLEKAIHRALSKHRIRKQREFFRLPTTEAIQIIQEVCNSPATRNAKIAPRRSPNYRDSRWLTPDKLEFNAIRKELWVARRPDFERNFLTDPSIQAPPTTMAGKLKDFFLGSEHDFSRLTHDTERRNACQRTVVELKGFLQHRYGGQIVLCASQYSIARVYLRSAVDMQADRIRLILSKLQEVEREISAISKQTYEKRYQERVSTTTTP